MFLHEVIERQLGVQRGVHAAVDDLFHGLRQRAHEAGVRAGGFLALMLSGNIISVIAMVGYVMLCGRLSIWAP